jgi:hypothetical protein
MSTHDAPSEPEPRTPVWLTVLGAFLFLALAVYLLAPRSAEPDATVRVPAPDDAPAAADEAPRAPTPTAPPPPAGDE